MWEIYIQENAWKAYALGTVLKRICKKHIIGGRNWIRLSIGTWCRLLWTRFWSSRFHKMWGMSCLADLKGPAPRSWWHPRPMVWSVRKTRSPKDSHTLYFITILIENKNFNLSQCNHSQFLLVCTSIISIRRRLERRLIVSWYCVSFVTEHDHHSLCPPIMSTNAYYNNN